MAPGSPETLGEGDIENCGQDYGARERPQRWGSGSGSLPLVWLLCKRVQAAADFVLDDLRSITFIVALINALIQMLVYAYSLGRIITNYSPELSSHNYSQVCALSAAPYPLNQQRVASCAVPSSPHRLLQLHCLSLSVHGHRVLGRHPCVHGPLRGRLASHRGPADMSPPPSWFFSPFALGRAGKEACGANDCLGTLLAEGLRSFLMKGRQNSVVKIALVSIFILVEILLLALYVLECRLLVDMSVHLIDLDLVEVLGIKRVTLLGPTRRLLPTYCIETVSFFIHRSSSDSKSSALELIQNTGHSSSSLW